MIHLNFKPMTVQDNFQLHAKQCSFFFLPFFSLLLLLLPHRSLAQPTPAPLHRIDRSCTDFQVTISKQENTCSGAKVCLRITGGTAPYTVTLSNGDQHRITDNLEFCFNDLAPGQYEVFVTDRTACSQSLTFAIPIIDYFLEAEITSITCFGAADGAIDLRLPIGPPLHFRWTGPNGFSANTEDISMLEAGEYKVAVSYEDGTCYGRSSFTIEEPRPISTHLEITSDPCELGVDACLTIDGGTEPYWLWVFTSPLPEPISPRPVFHQDGTASIEGMVLNTDWAGPVKLNAGEAICGEDIPAAVYYLLIVDQNGCWLIDRILIESQGFDIRGVVLPASCAGDDGAIDITVLPENQTYFYRWSNGETTEDIRGLSPGTYTVMVYNEMDLCTAEATFEVPASFELRLNLEFDPYGSEACVRPQGTPPYDINWTSLDGHSINYGTSPGCIFDLAVGIYLVEVSDAAGCSASEIFIIEPKPCLGGYAIVEPEEIRSGQSTHFVLRDWSGESLQWQFRTAFTEWLDIPGATQERYATPPIQVGSDKEIWVRALVICRDGSVLTSREARLLVYGDPNLAQWPHLADDRELFEGRDWINELVSVGPSITTGPVELVFRTNRSNQTRIRLIGFDGQVYDNRTLGETLAGSTQHFSLHNLPAGWYTISLESAGQLQNYRVLHQKL